MERLKKAGIAGEVLTDRFSRGRYATDASAYQVMPAAVVIPKSIDDVSAVIDVARGEGVPVTARGGGTSQCGQAINSGVILDVSRHLNRVLDIDAQAQSCVVEPGVVLDDLNRQLAPLRLWFPVDISTSSRATIGGMAGNNSCGGRSLRYGTMRDNVISIDALLADGSSMTFNDVCGADATSNRSCQEPLFRDLLAIGRKEAVEIEKRFPKVSRRVGGYNLDALIPQRPPNRMADILVGSEGTLAFSKKIKLKLSPTLGPRGVGVCHFGSFYEAMDAAQHLVGLGLIALELVDRTMIALGRDIPVYRETIDTIIRGDPDAVLIAEFAEEETENRKRLADLADCMAELGFGWDKTGNKWGGVVNVDDPALQNALTEVRKGGLNIMMSMKQAGKPVSFVEDCAVPLEHLAEYTEALTRLFEKHDTSGTWYAHASVGCLHVRPILNLKLEKDRRAMRAIAEETFVLVREFKGSHSGEHGDGIVRSEFHEVMYGRRIADAFEEVKTRFDPDNILNPGRIVRPAKMDDRNLLRYGPDYREAGFAPSLDWSSWPGAAGGLQGAVEMCNNNGACRKTAGGVMCPSWRATHDEKHVVRGRANTLRLALSGLLGADALTSDDMMETMKLCVSCKACRRECPTGVDMARMKIEVLAARAAIKGVTLRDRLFSDLPVYAPYVARYQRLMNLRDTVPGAAYLSERLLGLAAKRSLPIWSKKPFGATSEAAGRPDGRPVALFVDTFNRWFEPEIARDAVSVLGALGYSVRFPADGADPRRPLCCGRTYLATGQVDRARRELSRTSRALLPLVKSGIPILGLEPSCMLTFRDELEAVLPGQDSRLIAGNTFLLDEYLVSRSNNRLSSDKWKPLAETIHVHGHCHQKSFGTFDASLQALRAIPDLEVNEITSGCCGMAGSFGYQKETYDISLKMAELDLLPAIRAIKSDDVVAASGTSCRHQIDHGTGHRAVHPVQILARAL